MRPHQRALYQLIGITLYSPDRVEIISAIRSALSSRDADMICAALHGTGHLARRFGRGNPAFIAHVEARTRHRFSHPAVRAALQDMRADVAHFRLPRR